MRFDLPFLSAAHVAQGTLRDTAVAQEIEFRKHQRDNAIDLPELLAFLKETHSGVLTAAGLPEEIADKGGETPVLAEEDVEVADA